MNLARAHRLVGLTALGVFISTGIFLRIRHGGWEGISDAARFLYRANHVYILLSSLINLALGIAPGPGLHPARRLGSLLVLAAPAVLFVAFATEPAKASPVRPFTEVGIIMLAAGVLLRALGRATGR